MWNEGVMESTIQGYGNIAGPEVTTMQVCYIEGEKGES